MKRILAVFLTLAMALNIAPMAAFAAADSDAASIVAVEETDENASSQMDEQTARAIASDPFLQAAYAQTEQKQTGQAEVDTSDVSMEATDSFGKLLLADIDEQQTNGTGNSNDKITGVTVSGNTATVEYLSYDYADLVVAIYTDDAEQEMVASGTAGVMPTLDDKIAQKKITLKGNIPSSFVVKAYMISDPNHEPLCNAFVSNEYTQDMKDLANASVADYPEERVVNLDDQMDTNFAVVNEDVVLINQDDTAVGAMSIAENGDGSYTITNADTKIKALDVGDVFVYQDDDNGILILQIETIDIEGNTVTITGNDSLELIDVFDIVKIESSDDGSELEYDGTGVDSDVHYLGVGVADDYDETNAISSGEISGAFAHKFVIGTDTFMNNEKDDEDDKDKLPEDTHITSKFGINAVLNLKITAKIKYYVSLKKQSIDYSVENEMSGGIEVYQKQSIKIDVGHFKKELPGVYLNYTPQLVYEGDVKGEFYYKVTGKQGFKCEDKNIVDTSEKPTSEISIKISGTVYIGVEYAPTLKIGFYKLFAPKTEENLFELLEAKITLQAGAEAEISTTLRTGDTATKKIVANANLPDSCHECAVCLAGDIHAKVNLTVSIDVIKVWQDSWTLVDIRPSIGKVYYSEDHHKFGFGDCPYNLYLVDISIDKTDLPENTEVFVTDGAGNAQSIGTLQGSTGNYCYMSPGEYTLKTTVQNEDYSCKIEVKNTKVKALLKRGKGDGGSTGEGGDADGNITGNDKIIAAGVCGYQDIYSTGDNVTWKLDEAGTLTISGNGGIESFYSDENNAAPWLSANTKYDSENKGNYRDKIKKVVIENGVSGIGKCAFYNCYNIEEVLIADSVAWIQPFAFYGCKGLTNITIPDSVIVVLARAFADCTNLTDVKLPNSDKARPSSRQFAYIHDSAFENCASLTSIVIPDTVKEIKNCAFMNSGLTSVTIPASVTKIRFKAFDSCPLTKIVITSSVKEIEEDAFANCRNLKDVYFTGTESEWAGIKIGDGNNYLELADVHCNYEMDDAASSVENSITTGTASTSGSKFQATFANAKAGKEYVVLVSRAKYNSLSADNLIYINQITADADGELAVPFITAADAAEMTYVVACAQDDATVEPGQPDQPGGNKPGGGHPSSGDDGGGAAIILIGGVAAVAAVAGAVLMMPVKVEGTVKLADQPVTNATVQVLKNGNVAAQTTTDANGHFTVKVKRGGYTLRVQWTDASGQPVTRTVDFKAPNANLNVAA